MPRLLVIAETDGAKILPATMPVIAFAQQWAAITGGIFDVVVIGGESIEAQADQLDSYGADHVFIIVDKKLEHITADSTAAAIVGESKQGWGDYIAGPATQFGRDILPHIAALMDAPMISDVLAISAAPDGPVYKRPMYAGNVIATVKPSGARCVFSVRGTAFGQPAKSSCDSSFERLPVSKIPSAVQWIGLEAGGTARPELTGAHVVVSGGRPLRDAATFERVLGGLADKLGGAVGATRAAVDSGIAPNELQVGQTGKIVAPDLYIAAGVSGSVQHLAGMKDSKVIVAINNDPDAPIFQVADYGLVADLHQAVPELTEKL